VVYKRVVFERGLEIGAARNSLPLPSNVSSLADITAFVWANFKVRPILLTEEIPSRGDRHHILTTDSKNLLNILLGGLQAPTGLPENLYISIARPRLNLQYVAGALVYHCEQLALRYSAICDLAVQDADPIHGGYFNLQGQDEAYYEFDSLVTAARRTYDSMRYILWLARSGLSSSTTGEPSVENTTAGFRRAAPFCSSVASFTPPYPRVPHVAIGQMPLAVVRLRAFRASEYRISTPNPRDEPEAGLGPPGGPAIAA
jgi:hypothetical protein